MIPRAAFEQNLAEKLTDEVFCTDMAPLLRLGVRWDPGAAAREVGERLLARLPGEPRQRAATAG